jgi:hypothetical protein
MDLRVKKYLVQQNIYNCKFGIYQNFPTLKSQKNFYNENFKLAPPYEYANVSIKTNHPIDVAYEFTKIGNKPVIINTVSPNFEGTNLDSCEGFKDPLINIRTSFNKTLNSFNLYPIKGTEVVYAPQVYIIRNESMQGIHPGQIGKISIITAPLDDEIELKPLKSSKIKSDMHFKFDDYIQTSQLMETIFQTALLGGNDTIIFNDFGCKTNNYPIDDIIDMFNSCIYKYGHMFKNIIIATAVSNQIDMGYTAKFNEKIIYPQKYIQEFINNEKSLMNELQMNINNQINIELANEEENNFNPFAQLTENNNSGNVWNNQPDNDSDDEKELKKMQKLLQKY